MNATARTRAVREAAARPGAKRVAVYTRQSVDRSSGEAFGSLDAQREAIEAYVRSQAGEGWRLLPERYDDGGFSGGTTDRPAFQRLMEDLKGGRIDIVAVYKIDRLSRSLIDFAEIVRVFEQHGVEFVSITQQFSTGSSMGKLTLNILMSFAEFERGVISERTRDKIAATRRKGMWTGGPPPLGYRLDRGRLVVVPDEAARVREIFGLYLKLGTLNELVAEMNRRGWTTKPGRSWGKSSAHHFLTRILFVGKVPYKDEVHEGQHEAIIDPKTFDAVQRQLRQHGQRGGSEARNKWALLLRGLLSCGRCGARMAHTYSAKDDRRWHYYLCPSLSIPGSDRCEGHRVAAREIESFVIGKIREAARHPEIVTLTARAAQAEAERKRPELLAEQRRIGSETKQLGDERRNLVAAIGKAGKSADALVDRLGELDDREARLRDRLAVVHAELVALEQNAITEDEVRVALKGFDEVWAELLPREQQRLVRLLIAAIRFHADTGEVDIEFRPGGIQAIAEGRGR